LKTARKTRPAKKARKATPKSPRPIRHRRAVARKAGGVGSSFDDFLKEEGVYEETQAAAIKRVLAWQLAEEMKRLFLTKAEMARRMATSRSQLDRLLDPDNDDVKLGTLARAAEAVGRRLKLELA
jgi:hypothetical protein